MGVPSDRLACDSRFCQVDNTNHHPSISLNDKTRPMRPSVQSSSHTYLLAGLVLSGCWALGPRPAF